MEKEKTWFVQAETRLFRRINSEWSAGREDCWEHYNTILNTNVGPTTPSQFYFALLEQKFSHEDRYTYRREIRILIAVQE